MGYVAMAGDTFGCPNSGRRQRSVVLLRSILQCSGQALPALNHTARVVCTVVEKLTQIHRTKYDFETSIRQGRVRMLCKEGMSPE